MEEILSIWGSFHAAGFANAKYYLNPFTLKLEPLMSSLGIILRFLFVIKNNYLFSFISRKENGCNKFVPFSSNFFLLELNGTLKLILFKDDRFVDFSVIIGDKILS